MTFAMVCVARGEGVGVPLSPPQPLNTNAIGDVGVDASPHVAADGLGHWVAVWHANNDLGRTIGTDYDIMVSRSADGGLTWTPPEALNSTASQDNGKDQFPRVATDGQGVWICVWQSTVHPDASLGNDQDTMFARSTDNGQTWTPMTYIGDNADSDKGNDVEPTIHADGNGVWIAAWRSNDSLLGTIGNDRDILFSRSVDAGLNWSSPAPLNTNATLDTGFDLKPQLASDHGGHWICVWQSNDSLGGTIGTDFDILCSRSGDGGVTWLPPQSVKTTAGSDTIRGDFDPQIACDHAGHWTVAWSSEDNLAGTIGTEGDILVSRSADDGATWSPAAAMNTNAATDAGVDQLPRLATDAAGNWIAVWQSNDSLGGTIGSDGDILISGSVDNGLTWTAPIPANTNAATDFGADDTASIVSDKQGGWLIVWEKNDAPGSPLGTEGDVLCAHLAIPDCNLNTIADHTEPDGDGDGIPDDCDTTGPPCVADIAPPGPPAGNGVVNIDDLLAVINAWGPCGNPNNCPADIAPPGLPAGNDVVNIDDLLAIINGWGPCP